MQHFLNKTFVGLSQATNEAWLCDSCRKTFFGSLALHSFFLLGIFNAAGLHISFLFQFII